MNFKLKNNTKQPQYCDTLNMKLPANGESRILTEGEYLLVLKHPVGYDWASLVPIAVEGESKKQALAEEAGDSSETLTQAKGKGRGRHKEESQDE